MKQFLTSQKVKTSLNAKSPSHRPPVRPDDLRLFGQERGGPPGPGAVAHRCGGGQGPEDRGARVEAAGAELEGGGPGAATEVGICLCVWLLSHSFTESEIGG